MTIKISYNMKKILLCFIALIFNSYAFSQSTSDTISITGTVFSEISTKPLIGASIKLKEKNVKTTTDINGNFVLKAQKSDVLMISFIGYVSQYINIKDIQDKNITIHLNDSGNNLDEVIVSSGYQQISKFKTTGSYAEINKSLLERGASNNIITRLNGITPGLLFDNRGTDQPNISIRGRSTLASNNSPLIIVDNFPYEGDIKNINPNDVLSITILKDAAAAAVWGARAGNGVIVITTKQSKFNDKSNIELNSSVTIGNKLDLFYNPSFLNSSAFIDVEKLLFDAGFYTSSINSPSKPLLSPVVELLKLGTINSKIEIEELRGKDVRNEFSKFFYRESINQQYNLNLSGGGTNYSYYISGGYNMNFSNLIGNSDERFTLNTINTFKPLENFTIQAGVNLVYTNAIKNNPGYSEINSGNGRLSLYPYAQLADKSGLPLPVAKDYPLSFSGNPGNGFIDWQYRPLEELKLSNNKQNNANNRVSLDLKYDLLKSLNVQALYQIEKSQNVTNGLSNSETYFTRNLINIYKQTGDIYPIPIGGILNVDNIDLKSQSGRFQINYNEYLAKHHYINLLLGSEIRDTRIQQKAYRLYGYDDDILVSSSVNYQVSYKTNPGNRATFIPYPLLLNDKTDRYLSYFSNLNYNFKSRYFFSASARKDQSNLFGVNSNQKGVPLWSVGSGWQVSDESFYNIKAIPYLKLRASYGFSGNVNKSMSAYSTALYTTDLYTKLPNAIILTPPNPELRWEKIRIINVGADFEIINKRLSGSFEYYWKNGTDQIGNAPLDPTTGYFLSNKYSYTRNNATIEGHGMDIELNSINTIGKIKWRSRFILSHTRDKVTNYEYQNPIVDYLNDYSSPLLGRPVYGIYSYKWAGLEPLTGDPMIYLDGVPSKDYSAIATKAGISDLVYHGPALPPLFGSLLNTITWKNFTFSANVMFKFGYYYHRSSISYVNLFNNWLGHKDYEKRWMKPGDEVHTNVPSISLTAPSSRDIAYNSSSALVSKRDHIRLQDMQLAYSLNQQNFRSLPVRGLTFTMYATNLGILWKANKDGLDPDYLINNSVVQPIKTISIGLRSQF